MEEVIVIGSGHLANRIRQVLEKKSYSVCHLSAEGIESSPDYSVARLQSIKTQLKHAGAERARAIYVVDSEDRRNIEFALAAMSFERDEPIFLALFNEKIAPHFQINCKNLFIMNPARLAASTFADAVTQVRQAPLPAMAQKPEEGEPDSGIFNWLRSNVLLTVLLSAFLLLYTAGAIFFRYSENLRWIDAFYFITTVITTTGFGDIHLRYSSDEAKLFVICTMLTSVSFFSIIFALVVDKLMERRSQVLLGRKTHRLKGHVILCGLGRLGYQIALELRRRGFQIVVIESNEHNRFLNTFRARGIKILYGDATLLRNLEMAGLLHAVALFSVINDDLTNLEIGLHARSLDPSARLILRIYDRETAEAVRRRLNIEFAYSTSAIAADEMVRALESIELARN